MSCEVRKQETKGTFVRHVAKEKEERGRSVRAERDLEVRDLSIGM